MITTPRLIRASAFFVLPTNAVRFPTMPAPVQFELIDATGRLPPAALAWVDQHARAALVQLGLSGSLRVRIVGDDEMSQAHVKYCDIPGTTDVLTFDLSDTPGVLDVDILACLDEAQRQAQSRSHEVQRELLLYIVHGLLHTQGHDDHDEAAYARMHAEEDRLLSAIGVGPTFARDDSKERA
jgi:probable rRNA maturation factor